MNKQRQHFIFGNKGFFFSLDALFALVVALGMLLFIFFSLAATHTQELDSPHFHRLSTSILENLEKQGHLATYITSSSSVAMIAAIEETVPSHLCYELSVHTSDALVESFGGPCLEPRTSVSTRSFYASDTLHYARLKLFFT